MILPELLADPVRARIYIEVLINEEITAQQLMKRIRISRSTMSHHLSRFVEDNVFNVRIPDTGRPIKFYSHNPAFKEELIIEGNDSTALKNRISFLESASAHLHVISSLLQERADKIQTTKKNPAGKKTITFTFSFMSAKEANIWNEEYESFQKRFEERRKNVEKSGSLAFIGYGGIVPTR